MNQQQIINALVSGVVWAIGICIGLAVLPLAGDVARNLVQH